MERIPVDPNLAQDFAETCRRSAAYGLSACSSGNLSRRDRQGTLLVSASRSWLSDLHAEQVCRCSLDGDWQEGPKPSVETRFHAGILRTRPEVEVVLHGQTPAATAVACMDPLPESFYYIPEIPYYLGPIGIVPYLPPGSPELADAVVACAQTHDFLLLRHHGQVALGRSVEDAVQKTVFFELACRILLDGGPRVVPLADEAAAQLLQAGQAGRLGAPTP